MPKLRLFHGPDPLESDAIPFPRERAAARLRLTDAEDSIEAVESALERAQSQLDDARSLLTGSWFDDDGPKAA